MAKSNFEKLFVMSDVHGNIKLFNQLLKNWNPDTEQLLILGDLGDRGPDSKACFEKAKYLVEEHGAICLRGNHEEMLSDFLKEPKENGPLYFMNGGLKTLASFLEIEDEETLVQQNIEDTGARVKEKAPWLMSFIDELLVKYEWEDYVFVHAGVNLTLPDWRESSDFEYVWIREGFLDQENPFDKTFIFGHTPTVTIHDSPSDFSVWTSGDGKIGIDGGAVYGGVLHGLVITKDGIEKHYEVSNE